MSGDLFGHNIVFRVAEDVPLAVGWNDPSHEGWSPPVRFRFEKQDDGRWDLVMQTVRDG